MSDKTLYRVSDGLFVNDGVVSDLEGAALLANTPAGHAWIEGAFDHMCQRVDPETEQVVDYQPPAPPDDAMQTWAWDEALRRWISSPTLVALGGIARVERDRRMAAADWVTLRSVRTGQPIPADWAAYLQALADVPELPGFPTAFDWPTPPAT